MFENLKNQIKHTIKMIFDRLGVEIRLKSSLQKEATVVNKVETVSIPPLPTYGILKPSNSPLDLESLAIAGQDIMNLDLEGLCSSQNPKQSIQTRIAIQKQFRQFLHFFCTGQDTQEDYQLMLIELDRNLAQLINFARRAKLPDRCRLFALRGSQIYYLFGDRYYSKDSPLCARLVRSCAPLLVEEQSARIEQGMAKTAIDYPQHPAFVKCDRATETDAEIAEKIQAINGLVEVAKIALSGTETNPKTVLLEMVCQPVKELFDAIAQKTPDVERFAEFLDTLYERTIDGLCRDISQSHQRGTHTGVFNSPASINIHHTLEKQGFVLEKIPHKLLEEFESLLTPYKEQIKANYEQGLTSRTALSTNKIDRKVIDCLYSLLDRFGIIEGVSNYVGSKIKVGFALELSVPNSVWWRSRYSRFDCETQNTAYFHTDEAPEIPKAILYLSDVQPENGPFTIIPDSYQWERPALPWVISRVIDSMGDLMKYPDLPEEDSCDRHLLVSALGRQHFLLLPPSLRFVSHFGNDVLTNTELENYLMNRSYAVTRDTANCIIFDGGRLIHRGGLVQQGERWACQIGFFGEQSYTQSLMKGWRNWVN